MHILSTVRRLSRTHCTAIWIPRRRVSQSLSRAQELPPFSTIASIALGLPLALITWKAGMSILLQDKLIYTGYLPFGSRTPRGIRKPVQSVHDIDDPFVRGWREIWLETRGEWRVHRIQTWVFEKPPPSLTADNDRRPVLLYFQGYARTKATKETPT